MVAKKAKTTQTDTPAETTGWGVSSNLSPLPQEWRAGAGPDGSVATTDEPTEPTDAEMDAAAGRWGAGQPEPEPEPEPEPAAAAPEPDRAPKPKRTRKADKGAPAPPDGKAFETGGNISNAAKALITFVERFERVSEEISTLKGDQKEILDEAKALGYNVPIIRKVLARRKMDPDKRHDMDQLLALYEESIT